MKKLMTAIVGYGNRGQIYADYSLDEPLELGVAAVIDPNDFKLQEAKKKYGLSDDCLFHERKRGSCASVIAAMKNVIMAGIATSANIISRRANAAFMRPSGVRRNASKPRNAPTAPHTISDAIVPKAAPTAVPASAPPTVYSRSDVTGGISDI